MNRTDKRFNKKLFVIIILLFILGFTSIVLAYSLAEVENNVFNFGKIHIEIGYVDVDGTEHYGQDGPAFSFEGSTDNVRPGEVISKTIFIENQGNLPTYYGFYFENINGRLANQINVRIINDNGIVLLGDYDSPITADEFTIENIVSLGILEGHSDRAYYTLELKIPDDIPAIRRGELLKFDLCAEGVQVENNEDKEFVQ